MGTAAPARVRPRVSNAITGVATENRHAGQKYVLHGTSEYLRLI